MRNNTVTFKQGACLYSIDADRIVYILCGAHKVTIVLDEKEIEYKGTVNSLMKVIPEEFIRVHKGYIANMNRIEMIESNIIHFDDGKEIPVGRTFKKELYNALLEK